MNKKIVLGLGMCIVLLMTFFAGCTTTQTTELDPTLQRIKDAGKLVVGTNAEFAPWEFVNETTGEFEGLDIDVANEIARYLSEKLGATIEVEIENMAFDEELFAESLNNSEVDIVIAALTINTERGKIMSFSNSYYSEGQTIIVNDSVEDISGPTDLATKTVGAQNGTTGYYEALNYANITIPYDTPQLALDALLAGEIDAIVIDSRAGEDLIEDVSGVKIVGQPFTEEFYGIAIKKGETALKEEVDKAIADLKSSGKMEEIENKWL